MRNNVTKKGHTIVTKARSTLQFTMHHPLLTQAMKGKVKAQTVALEEDSSRLRKVRRKIHAVTGRVLSLFPNVSPQNMWALRTLKTNVKIRILALQA